MKFEERLLQARRERNMNQETLAEQIGVTRQAVSKWETGEAFPDYAKLVALADVLGISLDELCGREAAPAGEQGGAPEREPGKKRSRWRYAAGVAAALLLFGCGFWAGTGWPGNGAADPLPSASEEPAAPALPDVFAVSMVKFTQAGSNRLQYYFVPSVFKEGYTYQISFHRGHGGGYVFDAAFEGGGCSGTVPLPYDWYAVTATVSNGVESRTVSLTDRLEYPGDGTLSWQGIDN